MNAQAALLLLADSQLLFRPHSLPMLARHFAGRLPNAAYPNAAYIGASNGHQPEFHQLACAALETLFGQPLPCAFIRSAADVPAQPVNLLILAGGSVQQGWEFLQQPPIRAWVNDILQDSSTLAIGVSAGAIHLARGCDPERPQPVAQAYLDCFPHFIAVHEEQQGWPSRQTWRAGGCAGEFIPIPLGGGLWIQGRERAPVGSCSQD